ncbi:MAG: hypothetical protein IIA67_11470 [Planctomycetes bacterium]|nr:hypothetical protein [Planctomycetota bacterium]
MIDSTTQRRQLRDEIARLRRRIDRRVAPLAALGCLIGVSRCSLRERNVSVVERTTTSSEP